MVFGTYQLTDVGIALCGTSLASRTSVAGRTSDVAMEGVDVDRSTCFTRNDTRIGTSWADVGVDIEVEA